MLRPAPYQQPSYQAAYTPAPSYNVQMHAPAASTVQTAAPANCPAGTTAQSDGTCLQGGSPSYATSSYSSAPSYNAPSSTAAQLPISQYDWGSKDTTWGGDSYVSPGSRVVDSPSYPEAPEADYYYTPVRK